MPERATGGVSGVLRGSSRTDRLIVGRIPLLARHSARLHARRPFPRFGINSHGRQLKDGSALTLFQVREQHDLATRKLQGVVMGYRFVLVDLSKDGGLAARNGLTPHKQTYAPNFVSEGQLRPRQQANCDIPIFQRRKPCCAPPKVARC